MWAATQEGAFRILVLALLNSMPPETRHVPTVVEGTMLKIGT